jgi:hypothetical protein
MMTWLTLPLMWKTLFLTDQWVTPWRSCWINMYLWRMNSAESQRWRADETIRSPILNLNEPKISLLTLLKDGSTGYF